MSLTDLASNLNIILGIVVLTIWACALLLVDLAIPKDRKGWTALLAAVGLLVTLVISLSRFGQPQPAFGGMVVNDGFSVFLDVIFLVSGVAGITLAYDYLKRMGWERGEYYVLLLFAVLGMMLMAHAADLMVIFLALELLSIPLYILAGIAQPQVESEEASLKYFLLGAFSGGFVVYGIALIFGATGTTSLAGVIQAIKTGTPNFMLLLLGAGLFLVGLGFKVAIVPFHMWTPDVYQGSPAAVTAFMAVGAKAGGFAALLRVFFMAFQPVAVDLTPILWALAVATMILGNVVAIAQSNIKRMLAYSSIANAGYILMALVPYGQGAVANQAVASALVFLAAYALTSFTAWAVVISLERTGNLGQQLDDFAGLGRKFPALAAAMAVAMLSFTGVPPTLGFVAKFYLFGMVVGAGYIGLALIGVLTSLISAYYYLRLIVIMYMRDGEPQVRKEPWLYATALVAAVCTVVLSIFAAPLFNFASQAVLALF